MNVLPCPSSLRTEMVPWWASTMAREMVSPRPLPGITRWVTASVRKNRSKIRSRSAAGMPMPVSETLSTASFPWTARVTSTFPSSGVNFTALEMRLPRSWAMRVGSTARRGTAAEDMVSSMRLYPAAGRASCTASAARPARSVSRTSSASVPDCIWDRNSRSPTRRRRRSAG